MERVAFRAYRGAASAACPPQPVHARSAANPQPPDSIFQTGRLAGGPYGHVVVMKPGLWAAAAAAFSAVAAVPYLCPHTGGISQGLGLW